MMYTWRSDDYASVYKVYGLMAQFSFIMFFKCLYVYDFHKWVLWNVSWIMMFCLLALPIFSSLASTLSGGANDTCWIQLINCTQISRHCSCWLLQSLLHTELMYELGIFSFSFHSYLSVRARLDFILLLSWGHVLFIVLMYALRGSMYFLWEV